jgi:hypothetical protein
VVLLIQVTVGEGVGLQIQATWVGGKLLGQARVEVKEFLSQGRGKPWAGLQIQAKDVVAKVVVLQNQGMGAGRVVVEW